MFSSIRRVFRGFGLAVCLSLIAVSSFAADTASPELTKLFPNKLGTFKQAGLIRSDARICETQPSGGLGNGDLICGQSNYVSEGGEKFQVEMLRLRHDAEAYALLTQTAETIREVDHESALIVQNGAGTASVRKHGQIVFFKGLYLVRISELDRPKGPTALTELARQVADELDKGEGDIPALVKHLPGGEGSQNTARFYPRLASANFPGLNQPVFGVVDGQGDADAVLATVGPAKVIIVEFNTPQLASENDHRIIAKIRELWNQGLPAPTAYRRVGNYSVFVFDAPNEQTAKLLIDDVKYEQVVQWLGDNPYLLQQAQRRYVETTMGVFIAVIKASGVALIGCFAAGGLFGALLFLKRRKQQRMVEAFSDAGGMLRLNLDELSAQPDYPRLLQERN